MKTLSAESESLQLLGTGFGLQDKFRSTILFLGECSWAP